MVQPPATLDGYSFSHRLEVTKNIKGSHYGIPDGRLAFRTRQRAGSPVDSSVTYNTAFNGVSVMAQLDTGGMHVFVAFFDVLQASIVRVELKFNPTYLDGSCNDIIMHSATQ